MWLGAATGFTVIVASTVVAVTARAIPEPFRGFGWYATLGEVKKRETAEFVREERREGGVDLWYRTTAFDEPVTLSYTFDPVCEQLFSAEYVFDRTLPRLKFHLVIEALKAKYGPWKHDETDFPGSLAERGMFVWETRYTTIVIIREGSKPRERGKSAEKRPSAEEIVEELLGGGPTTVTYHTPNWHWMTGFKEGTEPDCERKRRILQKLKRDF